jgi:hypothetical protein
LAQSTVGDASPVLMQPDHPATVLFRGRDEGRRPMPDPQCRGSPFGHVVVKCQASCHLPGLDMNEFLLLDLEPAAGPGQTPRLFTVTENQRVTQEIRGRFRVLAEVINRLRRGDHFNHERQAIRDPSGFMVEETTHILMTSRRVADR